MKIRVEKGKIYDEDEIVSNGQFKIEFDEGYKEILLKLIKYFYDFKSNRVLYKLYNEIDWTDLFIKRDEALGNDANAEYLQYDIPIKILEACIGDFRVTIFTTEQEIELKLLEYRYTIFLRYYVDDIITDMGDELYYGELTIINNRGFGIGATLSKDSHFNYRDYKHIISQNDIINIIKGLSNKIDFSELKLYYRNVRIYYGYNHFYRLNFTIEECIKETDYLVCDNTELEIYELCKQIQSLGYEKEEEIKLVDVNKSLDSASLKVISNKNILIYTTIL